MDDDSGFESHGAWEQRSEVVDEGDPGFYWSGKKTVRFLCIQSSGWAGGSRLPDREVKRPKSERWSLDIQSRVQPQQRDSNGANTV